MQTVQEIPEPIIVTKNISTMEQITGSGHEPRVADSAKIPYALLTRDSKRFSVLCTKSKLFGPVDLVRITDGGILQF